jgi:hypothetical protein
LVQTSAHKESKEEDESELAMAQLEREQEEHLMRMFNSSMNLEQPAPISVQMPELAPKAVNYVSAHYTHSRHIQPAKMQREEAEIVSALISAGIDPMQLSPAQISLLATCPDVEFNQLLMAQNQLSVPDLESREHDRRSTSTMDTELDEIKPPPRSRSSPGVLYADAEPYVVAGYSARAQHGFCSHSNATHRLATDPVYLGPGHHLQDMEMEL